jgi:small subunit ribosomal protein S16
MAVKIRLQRHGRTKAPYYHIVVATSSAPRDGRFIERLGYYNPTKVPAQIDINVDKAVEWLDKGAQPTDTVRAILRYKGVLYKKHLMRGVKKGAFDLEMAESKFQDWLKSHENAVIDHVKTLEDKKAKERVAETAKYEAKRQERIDAERKALAAADAEVVEVEAAEVEAVETVEENQAEAVESAPVEETPVVEETVTAEAVVEEPAVEAAAEESPAVEETPAEGDATEEPSK